MVNVACSVETWRKLQKDLAEARERCDKLAAAAMEAILYVDELDLHRKALGIPEEAMPLGALEVAAYHVASQARAVAASQGQRRDNHEGV